MMTTLCILAVMFLIWISVSKSKSKGPMRPYLIVDGQLREIVHRVRRGSMVVCTIKPLQKGSRRSQIAIHKDSDEVKWLPKR